MKHPIKPEYLKCLVDDDPVMNDELYYAWCDGPGKDYPRHTEMMREIEGASLEPCLVMDHGWEEAFYGWAKSQ